MCHSDEALRVGDAQYPLPAVLGHEGAGIIVEVGNAVKDLQVDQSGSNNLASAKCLGAFEI